MIRVTEKEKLKQLKHFIKGYNCSLWICERCVIQDGNEKREQCFFLKNKKNLPIDYAKKHPVYKFYKLKKLLEILDGK